MSLNIIQIYLFYLIIIIFNQFGRHKIKIYVMDPQKIARTKNYERLLNLRKLYS